MCNLFTKDAWDKKDIGHYLFANYLELYTMRLSKLFYSAVLALLFPFQGFAWGHQGHRIVAELAMRQLSNATRQKVLQVLGTMTPAEAGNWMDEVRNDPAYDYMKPWHYTNIEPGQTYQSATGGDIITALNKAYGELQHLDTLSPERLRLDVLVLFHLCGDLTQPLHVGYGSDKGGNDYQVQYNGKGTNLHHIWDTDIIESQGITMASMGDSTTKLAAEYIDGLRSEKIDFMKQLQQSRNLLPVVYSLKGHVIDDNYMRMQFVIVHRQLFYGGFLLAACLEQLFSKAKNIPTVSKATGNSKPEKGSTVSMPGISITADQAAAHIGETVIVCDKVFSAKFTGGSGVTFINMGGEYPDNPFTAVIMFKNRNNFTYKPEEYLSGKTICVTGTVKDYKGKPEIVVEKEDQIKVQ